MALRKCLCPNFDFLIYFWSICSGLRAGSMMVFCLTCGLFAGSCLSYLALYGVTGSV